MTLDPLASLDRLAFEHPELQTLFSSDRGVELAEGVRPLARYLVGASSGTSHWLVDMLCLIAGEEMSWMRRLCRGSVLRAASATVSLLLHLWDHFQEEEESESGGEDPGEEGLGEEDPGGEDPGEEEGRVPEIFEEVPEGFPWPEFSRGSETPPEEAGAELAESLDASEMTWAALDQVTRTHELLETLHHIMPGGGWGAGRGRVEQALARDGDRLVELLRSMPLLRRIVEELGRLEEMDRKSRDPERGGRASVVGVRMGGELADVLPSELALLGDQSTEHLFYQRYAEHRLMSLEMEGVLDEPVGKGRNRGPVIACVDTSGSMEGRPEMVAKALVIAVLQRILPEGRKMRLILFGGPGDREEMDLGQGGAGMEALLRFLVMNFRHGTDFDGPLLRALEILEEEAYEEADILVITDGLCRARHDVIHKVEESRERVCVEVVSVVVGGDPEGVESFSDQVWCIDPDQPLSSQVDLKRWTR